MNSDEKLARIHLKVERAKKHLSELQIARNRFIETAPYRVVSEHDSQTGQTLDKVFDLQVPPAEIGLIAGDVAHNLRSALDHLAYALVIASGGTPTKQTAFPIYDDPAKYKAHSRRQVEGMAQTAKDVIDGIAPYKGSDDYLWGLHALDIADKHHALLLTLVHVGEVSFEVPSRVFWGSGSAFEHMGRPTVPDFGKPLKDGDVILVRELNTQHQPQFTFDVAFTEPEVFDGQAVLPTLAQMADRVEYVISIFKSLI